MKTNHYSLLPASLPKSVNELIMPVEHNPSTATGVARDQNADLNVKYKGLPPERWAGPISPACYVHIVTLASPALAFPFTDVEQHRSAN